jgi:hypothetical protein
MIHLQRETKKPRETEIKTHITIYTITQRQLELWIKLDSDVTYFFAGLRSIRTYFLAGLRNIRCVIASPLSKIDYTEQNCEARFVKTSDLQLEAPRVGLLAFRDNWISRRTSLLLLVLHEYQPLHPRSAFLYMSLDSYVHHLEPIPPLPSIFILLVV